MNKALVQTLIGILAVGVLVVSAFGAEEMSPEAAFRNRLLGDRFRAIRSEEVSALVDKYPEDAQLLYAASGYFSGERRQRLLERAISLDTGYEAVALMRELIRGVPGRVPSGEPRYMGVSLARASEILARLTVLDPENALPHWFLADRAFAENGVSEGFAQIAEALKKRRFETYEIADLEAEFRLLDALGRDGMHKFSIQAAIPLPYDSIGRQLSERLIERGKQRLSAGERAGALEDLAGADRLADELLLARPLFRIHELVVKRIKEEAAQARVDLYEGEGDAPSAAGALLQMRALSAYTTQMAATFQADSLWFRTFNLAEEGAGLARRLSAEALQAELAKPVPFGGALDVAAAQFREFTTSPEFESMMKVWFGSLWEEGTSVALRKAGEFYGQSSLPQKQERLEEAFANLVRAAEEFPKDKDWVCANNLKYLSRAVFMYANAHSGALPGSLDELVAGRYLEGPDMLKCPVNGTPYVYVGKGLSLRSNADPTTMVAYDDAPVHDGKRTVLFVDGHLERVPEQTFQHLMSQQPSAKALIQGDAADK